MIGIAFLCFILLFVYLFSNIQTADHPAVEAVQISPANPPDRDIVFYFKRNDNMEIALTFDDGPHPYYTPKILDILDKYDIKATFFMIGENVEYYPSAAEEVRARGHEIGNHTYHHKKLKSLTDKDILKEVTSCEDALFALGEYRSNLLRPPEGSMSESLTGLLDELGYRIILWDLDTKDWAHTPPAEISRHILDDIQSGDIILMHDFIGHNSPTPEALEMFIPVLLERGYKFVTVGELLQG